MSHPGSQFLLERKRRFHRLTRFAYINYEDTQLGAGDLYSTVDDLLRFDRALYDETLAT